MICIQRLCKQHDRRSFDCGDESLNRYFREQVSQDIKNRVAHCYVLCDSESSEVYGFYTLSNCSLELDLLPDELKRSRYSQLPFSLLGRMGISKIHHGKSFGKLLVADAVKRVISSELSPMGMIVDMKRPDLLTFYSQFGFMPLYEGSLRCVLIFPKLKRI